MYLISLYFDEKTNRRIQSYIHAAAEASQNTFMIEHHVPPHITIAVFETHNIESVKAALEEEFASLSAHTLQWVSIGVFKSSTLFIQPVLNEYLHNLSVMIHRRLSEISNTKISQFYAPFHWLPHTTIAKQMNQEQLGKAFEALQKSFGIFEGEVVRVELAKKTPFHVVASWKFTLTVEL